MVRVRVSSIVDLRNSGPESGITLNNDERGRPKWCFVQPLVDVVAVWHSFMQWHVIIENKAVLLNGNVTENEVLQWLAGHITDRQ